MYIHKQISQEVCDATARMIISQTCLKMFITIGLFVIVLNLQQTNAVVAPCTYVNGKSNVQNRCLNLTRALELIDDDVQLVLEPGEHLLQSAESTWMNVSGLSIIGQSENPNDVNITCGNGLNAGLAFFGMSGLLLANLTLKGLSLSSKQLELLNTSSPSYLKEIVSIPTDIGIGVFIGNSFNVSLENVVICNTNGLGLLGVNILANSHLTNVNFEYNKPSDSNCFDMIPNTGKNNMSCIGGGLYLIYQEFKESSLNLEDQTMDIINCHFLGNEDRSDIWKTELYYEYSSRLQREGYSIGGGGGVALVMTQENYNVHIEIKKSSFQRNIARFGSGAHIGLFTGVNNSSIIFEDCLFKDNGHFEIVPPFSGGGIALLLNLVRPNQTKRDYDEPSIMSHSTLTLYNSRFISNYALFGGGLYVYSLSGLRHDLRNGADVHVSNCHFFKNQASAGSTVIVYTRRGDLLNRGVNIEILDSSFDNNYSQFITENVVTPAIARVNFLMIRSGSLILKGKTIFTNNFGNVITCSSTPLYIQGDISISNNTGFNGALRLTDLGTLTLRQNSRLIFSKNSFAPSGGAIYVVLQSVDLQYPQNDCFLYFEESDILSLDSGCPDFDHLNVSIIFEQNTAPLGRVWYGSTLENCEWSKCLPNTSGESKTVFQSLMESNVISILGEQNLSTTGFKTLATPSKRIELVNYSQEHVMPGQTFDTNIIALDAFNQSIPETLGSVIIENSFQGLSMETKSHLGTNGVWYIDSSTVNIGSTTPVSIFGSQNQTLIVLLGSINFESTAYTTFNVTLTSCEVGFQYVTVNQSCVCDPKLSNVGVLCSINTGKLTIPEDVWFGLLDESNTSSFGYTSCQFSYCTPGSINITKGNFLAQCVPRSNRISVGCGGCAVNFSSTFGSSRCLQCSNYYLFLIFVFVFSGLITIGGMVLLHITITEGYLNSILFYCNSVNRLIVYFADYHEALIPISWISLNFGIETCFYDGMTTLDSYALRFAYIAYLFFLMGASSVLLFYFPYTRLYSPTKVLATLLILCYSSLLETCISILTFTPVYTINGDVLIRWYYDPNVTYGSGLHAFLLVLSVVTIILFVIPFPLLILSPKVVFRVKLFSKMKPLLDAFWGPLRPNCEWWVSFRLFFRWVIILLLSISVIPPPTNFFALMVCSMLFLYLQMKLQPFQGFWRNAIDDSLVVNLLLGLIGYIYFNDVNISYGFIVYLSVLVAIAYATFILILLIHLDLRYPSLRKRVSECYTKFKFRNRSKPSEPEPMEMSEIEISHADKVTHTEVSLSLHENDDGDESTEFTSSNAQDSVASTRFSRFRESLFEDPRKVKRKK